MAIFSGGYKPDATQGLMNLQSIRQMIFCIAQDDNSAQELDAFSMLGISNILGEIGYEIEQAYNKMSDDLAATKQRHSELRAALAALSESVNPVSRSDIAKILADDEQGVVK